VNVVAVSTPNRPEWRWRILDYNSQTLEESSSTFASIADAVAAGTAWMQQQADRDRQRPAWPTNR
jgi:hypothetical protein